jgi:hypothetical protein
VPSSAEYTALLGLVGAALAGAGAVAGADTIGDALASTVRTGICIVAGDVCRASDAEAAGLAPCTVAEHARGEGLTFTVASLRLGADDTWTAARRSDGSVIITHAEKRNVGGTVGVGVEASPLGVDVGLDGKLDYALGFGKAWEFPDSESAARFLRAEHREDREPTWRFGDAGTVLGGEASAGIGPVKVLGIESSAQMTAGVRTGRGLTTYYVKARVDALEAAAPGARLQGPTTGDGVVEVTRDTAGPREIAFRTVEPGTSGQLVETVARLDLRDAGNRAAADRLLSLRLPWPPAVHADLRTLVRRAVRTGVVERAVYDVRDGSDEIALNARFGLALGVDANEVDVDRRLVAASAWTQGSRERERADCGVTAAAG